MFVASLAGALACSEGSAESRATPDAGTGDSGSTLRYALLSETGLYADIATGELAPGMRPYRPRFELWSDGADKLRWLFLPEGERIDVSDPDVWRFPAGTRLFKEFSRDGVRVETRIIEKLDEKSWVFMAFQWNDAQSEAVAVPDGVQDASGTTHDIPSRSDCAVCHNGTPDRLLGLGAIQLAHGLGGWTLADLVSEELLTTGVEPPSLPGTQEAVAALGYLHANCGFCHNQRSQQFVTVAMDLRLPAAGAATVEDMPAFRTTVLRAPVAAPSGNTTSRVEPGSPESSTVVYRMELRGERGQMPPLATELRDETALGQIRGWIEQLAPGDAGVDAAGAN